MDASLTITCLVLLGVFLSLFLLSVSADLVLIGGVAVLLLTRVLDASEALGGLANEGLVTVALMFVVAEGLNQTGALSFVGPTLLGTPTSTRVATWRVMWPCAVISALMNNTPVVAMMMPVVIDWAKKCRLSASRLLLPLNYATILGGLSTLIGTSTNLVVYGLMIGNSERQIGMFEIGWVGIPAALAGMGFLALCSGWLIPERRPAMAELNDPREYTVEMLIDPTCSLVGRTIQQAGLRHLPGMYLMEIDRDGHVLAAVSSEERLRANDRLVFVGVVDSIVDLQKIPGLKPATDQTFKLDGNRLERRLIEAVVSNSCPIVRMTIRAAKFRSRYNAAVIAVARDGERINKKIGDIELQPGDTLLLEAHPSFLDQQRNSRDFFLVSEVANSAPPRHEKAWTARLILLMLVGLASFEVLSMLNASLLAAGLMLLFRCCGPNEARRSIDWEVLLAIAAAFGMGAALQKTGLARVAVTHLIDFAGDSPFLALVIIYATTALLTNLITNNAAAILAFPFAIATADRLSVNSMPFVISIMVAASCSFATPIGYQTNLMVYGPGGYRFIDYIRVGIPLTFIVGAVTIGLAPFVWPF